jgi:Holliday junction DNA helicase RuvA
MFYYVHGPLTVVGPNFAVVETGGVGYKLTISETTREALPHHHTAEQPPVVRLYTHLAVREDDLELFGFLTEEELSAFRQLLSVSGVGPKAAISILSILTPQKLAIAICTEDRKTISKAPGIGAKTAARIILELKDKLAKETVLPDEIPAEDFVMPVGKKSGKLSDAMDALVVLGYSRSEAQNVLKSLDVDAMELEEIIRVALKKMM